MSQTHVSTLKIKDSLSLAQKCLDALVRSVQTGVEHASLVSTDGFPILTAYRRDSMIDDEQLSALVASINSLIVSAMHRMNRQEPIQLTITTPTAHIIISPIFGDTILAVIAAKSSQQQSGAGLGLIYGLMKTLQDNIRGILQPP